MTISEESYSKIEKFDKPFTLEDVVKITPDESAKEIEFLLRYHFPCKNNKYYPNSFFMTNFTLRIVPTDYEIKRGVVVPGHRLIGFSSNLDKYDNFIFRYKGKNLKIKKINGTFESVYLTISLLDLQLTPIVDSNKSNMTLNGLNFKNFFKENNFQTGDSILVSCHNFAKKEFNIKYESQLERESDFFRTQSQDNIFLKSLNNIIKEKSDTVNSVCQITTSYLEYFLDKTSDFSIPLTSSGKMIIQEDGNISMEQIDMGRTILYSIAEGFNEEDYSLSADQMASRMDEERDINFYDIESIDEFFRYYDISISLIELRALIFDQLSEKEELNINGIFFIIFKDREEPDDEEQELFEKLLINEFNKINTKKYKYSYTNLQVVNFRKKLITATFKIVFFLRELDSYQITIEELPMKEMKELAHFQQMIVNGLYAIETISKKENLSQISKQIEGVFYIVDEIISYIDDKLLKGREKPQFFIDEDEDENDEFDIFCFKVSLCNWDLTYRGNPYRTFEIPSNSTLEDLANAIIRLFDFDDDHLYGFYEFKKRWTDSNERYELSPDNRDIEDVKNVLIDDVFSLKKKMQFLYDFGDEWKLLVKLESIREAVDFSDFDTFNRNLYSLIKTVGESPEQYPDYE